MYTLNRAKSCRSSRHMLGSKVLLRRASIRHTFRPRGTLQSVLLMLRSREFLLMLVTTVTLLSLWFQSESNGYYSRATVRRGSFTSPFDTKRPSRGFDEFFHKSPSDDALRAFFSFAPNKTKLGYLEPLWTCSDYARRPRERHRKLVFIHVRRAGGATIRALLKAYAFMCHAAFASVGRCVDLGREYLDGEENWMNSMGSRRSGLACLLSWAENRSGHSLIEGFGRVNSEFLRKHEIDILSGELPLGCDESWMSKAGNQVSAQYVTLIRDPVTKYISEFMFEHRERNLTSADAISLIRQRIRNQSAHGEYHNVFSNHFVSPAQKSWMSFEHVPWTEERKVNLSLSNLVNNHVAVLILERLPESLVILQSLIDGDLDVSNLFRFFVTTDKIAKTLRINANNRTSAILHDLQSDPLVMSQLEEILKYERQIYDWGVAVHEAQLRRLVSLGWPKSIEPKNNSMGSLAPFASRECHNITEC